MTFGLLLTAASGGGGPSAVTVIAAIVGSGGGIGGLALFLKLRPERDSLVVGTAQAALAMQTGLTENLRHELERATERLARVDALEDEISELREKVRLLEERNSELARDLRAERATRPR